PRGVRARRERVRLARNGSALRRRDPAPGQPGRAGRRDLPDDHDPAGEHPHRHHVRDRRPAPARAVLTEGGGEMTTTVGLEEPQVTDAGTETLAVAASGPRSNTAWRAF